MTTCYISCACNRTPHTLDWGRNGLVCYGARNSVAVYDPEKKKVYLTLHKHVNNVTVVRWIRPMNGEPETELISGSIDGTLIIWKKIGDNFEPTSILKDTSAIRIATAQYPQVPKSALNQSNLIICTGNIDGDLKIWLRDDNGDVKLSQTLEFKKKLPIEIGAWLLPRSNTPIIGVAMEDSSIQLISQDLNTRDKIDFIKIQTLIGHEDWVRCLDFTYDNNGDILLASGSQDSMIRLWRISSEDEKELINSEDLELKKETFLIGDKKYHVGLESILISHDGWIYGVNWHPASFSDEKRSQPMKLLSCSLDKTMILWEPDKRGSGIWLESIRVGDVGGNSLGFYGCKFGPEGNSLLAHGYQGSLHLWNYSEKTNNWAPSSAPSGHFSEVVDLSWDPKGRFLLTASMDQTTRAHAPWINDSNEIWHEIGRPQVHGYDIFCIAMLTPYMFASGAEEKVVRTFSAPTTFVNYLKKLSNADDCPSSTAESASVPALGLTNKAVFEGEIVQGENLYLGNSKDLNFDKPPTEEELIQHTLWPELQKLYGHGYEIFSMAAKHDGSLLATACKSSSVEHSAIILWDTKTWKIEERLLSHQLTVTQLEFSPNDEYLLSVSRDRRWSLFSCADRSYKLLAASSKRDNLHSRIIWSCAWSHDSKYFATGSRDGKIGIWDPLELTNKELLPAMSLEFKDESITALAFARFTVAKDSYILAIGFDSGKIEIHKLTLQQNSKIFRRCVSLDTSQAHHLTVKRLSFRPETEILQLASAGSDNIVKIHNFNSVDLSHS